MRFFTDDEAHAWAAAQGTTFSQRRAPVTPAAPLNQVQFVFPTAVGQLLPMCQFVARCLEPRSACLLWVTCAEVWPSSENWHLYYRLRQSYADYRLLHEAPGHLFLKHESADLVSFLELGALNGWDMHLIPELQYGGPGTARAFVSHDEWISLRHADPAAADEWRAQAERAQYRMLGSI